MQFEEIKSKIVVALDVKTLDEAKHLVDELKDYTGTFKVGLQLYCAFGNEIVDYIKGQNGMSVIRNYTNDQQYNLGIIMGKEIKKLLMYKH